VAKPSNNIDADLPQLYDIRFLAELQSADIVIATRFDTVKLARRVQANRRFYFVQQIETEMARFCGGTREDALHSYRDAAFEVLTIGEHLSNQLKRMGRNSTVLDVGFYRSMYPAKTKTELGKRPKVLFYAAGADYKGSGDIPHIVERLRRLVPDVFIGSFHRNKDIPVWSDAHYRPKSTHEVVDVYASHDVYVYPSRSDGFAMTPVEAMACGTPVVLTDFLGKDQYARHGHNCRIAPIGDYDCIADYVVGLLGTPLADEMRAGGLKTAERYDWSVVGAQYAKAILEAPL
jgi:glycosyltransferase involved in cell wall biosynthesis